MYLGICFRAATLPCYLLFGFCFRLFPAFASAIATACFRGLPAFISVLMFCEIVAWLLPDLSGIWGDHDSRPIVPTTAAIRLFNVTGVYGLPAMLD